MASISDLNPNKRTINEQDHAPAKKQKIHALYLEDYTPIRTVKVTKISENTSAEYIRGYFEHATAGRVEKVYIANESTEKESVAYVTFAIPEDAAKLICDSGLLFDIKFAVEEAESVHQPKIDPNVLNLVDIGEDCILHIMSFLDMIDVVSLGETCEELHSLTQRSYKKRKHFSFGTNTGDSSINEATLPKILQNIGSHIQSLEINGLNANILDALSKYCRNVTKLILVDPDRSLSSSDFKKNKAFFENINKLEVRNARLYDASMSYICMGKKIKKLKLEKCRHLRGKFISQLKKLKTLEIQFCRAIENDNVFGIRNKNKLVNLCVDICGCSYLHFLHTYKETFENFKELTLEFSSFSGDDVQLNNIKYLKKLTKLTVTRKYSPIHHYQNFDSLLTALREIETLHSLDIEQIEISIATTEHLANLQNLKCLCLKNLKNPIRTEFYSKLTRIRNLKHLEIIAWDDKPYEYQSISKMVTGFDCLDVFSHSFMGLPLLQMIWKNLESSYKRSAIEIQTSKLLCADPEIKKLISATKGALILSVNEQAIVLK